MLIAISLGATVVGILAERPHAPLHFHASWLSAAVVGLVAVELAQAELWRRLATALGAHVEPLDGLAIWCVSAVARYVPTSLLMPVLRVGMGRRRGIPPKICAASLVYETALAICASLCVGAYFIIAGVPALHDDTWRWGVLLIPLIALGGLHPTCMRAASLRVLRRLGQDPLPAYLPLGRLLGFAVGYLASFLLGGLGLLALVLACDALPVHDIPTVIGAFSVGFAASLFAFVLPGGLGAREVALVSVLSPVMPTFLATVVAVALRLIQLAIELVLALLTPWIATHFKRRESASPEPAAPAVPQATTTADT